MPARSEQLQSRPYCGYSKAEHDRWKALKESTNESGRKLTWREVSERTGIKVTAMKEALSRAKGGIRKGQCEIFDERAATAERMVIKGKKVQDIAYKLDMQTCNVSQLLRKIGISPEMRKQMKRVAGYRQETLDITRERRGAV